VVATGSYETPVHARSFGVAGKKRQKSSGVRAQALKVLAKLDPAKLTPSQQATLHRLRERAQAAAADDPYEIAADDW
jgi:hypothetical protein